MLWFQIHLSSKKCSKGEGKKKEKKIIDKLSDCKVISLVWISYLLAMHCRGMELDGHRGRSNARIKEWLGNRLLRSVGAAGTRNGIWNHPNGLGSLLFLLLSSERERGADLCGSPTAIPCPSTRSNACVGLDWKETEPGNQPWRMLWLTWQVYKNAKISDIIKDTKSVLTRVFFFLVFFFLIATITVQGFKSYNYSKRCVSGFTVTVALTFVMYSRSLM